jgi:polyphenol oxidase
MDKIITGSSGVVDGPSSDADETLTENGFYWRQSEGVKVLVSRHLEVAGFANGFSTRMGGVSPFPENSLNLAGFDEDTAANIYENRCRFLKALDCDFKLATVWQVHGDAVKVLRDGSDVNDAVTRADATVSDLRGVLVGVKTADCVPVLIGDTRTGAFAAVHAGWRGTARSIVVKAIEKMREVFGTDPSDLTAAIGPAAACEAYEVGQDVIDIFNNEFTGWNRYFTPTREGHALVDLPRANRDHLIGTGIRTENIYTAPFCTITRTDLFFSYRIEKKKYGKTGRLLSVIGRL